MSAKQASMPTSSSAPALNKSLITRAFIMVAFYWFSMYTYLPYTAVFLKGQGVTQTLIGMVTGAYGIAQIILRPPLGIAADLKGSQRRFILIGVFTPAIASTIRLIAPTGVGFLIGNFVSGIGAAMWICFMIFFARLFGKDGMQQATAIIMGANSLGQLVGYIAATLLYPLFGMTVLIWLSIGGSIIATAIASTLHEPKTGPVIRTAAQPSAEESPVAKAGSEADLAAQPSAEAGSEAEPKLTARELVKVFKNKRLLFFSIFAIMQTGIVLAAVTNFSTQAVKELGGGPFMVGLVTIVFMLSMVIFSLMSAADWFRRLGAKVWIPVCMITITLYCILSPLAHSILAINLLQILSGFYAGVITSFAVAEATKEIPDRMRTTAMGTYQCFVAIGIAALPMLSGWLVDVDNGSFDLAYRVMTILSIITVILAFWGTRTKKLDAKKPL